LKCLVERISTPFILKQTLFNSFIILFQGFTEVKKALCGSSCPKICPLIYAPVCARSSQGLYRLFSNECLRTINNCNKNNIRKCKKTSNQNKFNFILNFLLAYEGSYDLRDCKSTSAETSYDTLYWTSKYGHVYCLVLQTY
jgi:hypothetical protein